MRNYQIYFFVLKSLILLQLVLISLGFNVKESKFFLFVDTLFKISLGLFLGFFFWPYPPKGMNWEDGLIISIGGFLILTEIKFKPIVALYEQRENIAEEMGRALKNE